MVLWVAPWLYLLNYDFNDIILKFITNAQIIECLVQIIHKKQFCLQSRVQDKSLSQIYIILTLIILSDSITAIVILYGVHNSYREKILTFRSKLTFFVNKKYKSTRKKPRNLYIFSDFIFVLNNTKLILLFWS